MKLNSGFLSLDPQELSELTFRSWVKDGAELRLSKIPSTIRRPYKAPLFKQGVLEEKGGIYRTFRTELPSESVVKYINEIGYVIVSNVLGEIIIFQIMSYGFLS